VVTWIGYRHVFALVAASFLLVVALAIPLYRVMAPRTDGNIPL